MSRFFVDFFCLAVPKNFEGEPSCAVFRKVSGGEKVCGWEGRGGGEYQNFLPKTFCLTVPKKFVGEPLECHWFRVSKNFTLKRTMSRFFVDFCCLAVPKNFEGERFSAVFRKVSGSEEVCGWDGRGGGVSKISAENILSQSAEKNRRGTL